MLRRRSPLDWTDYLPMPERFRTLRAWGELTKEEAQAWFDELMASKEERISQVAALMARNGLDTSDPQRPGFWHDVTLWLDEHAEYDASSVWVHRDEWWGTPRVWCSIGADVDLWYTSELIERSVGRYDWVLPLKNDYSILSFQSLCFQDGIWGQPLPVLGCAINYAYWHYRRMRPPRASDLEQGLQRYLALPIPKWPPFVESDRLDRIMSDEQRDYYEELEYQEMKHSQSLAKPKKSWLRGIVGPARE